MVVVIYSPAGQGHLTAARALAAATGGEVWNVLDFAPRAFRYDAAWRFIQRRGGRAWDWLFDATKCRIPLPRLRQWVNRLLLRPLAAELMRVRPDEVVCTHYLPALTVAPLPLRTSIVVTDYRAHAAWVVPGVERYYAATDEVAAELRAYGARGVTVSGIPIGQEMRRPPVRPSGGVLFLASGVPRDELRRALRSLEGPVEIVAGGDPGLRAQLARWGWEAHGCVPSLQPLLDRAGVVITKAGGLVVSECYARGRAMILPFSAHGQERGNRAHAIANGAALALDDPAQLGPLLATIDRRQLSNMGRAARRAARPDASHAIAAMIRRERRAA